MFAVFQSARKGFGLIALLFSVLFIAACVPATTGGPSINTAKPIPVALLVPGGSESAGHAGLAQDLERAARLAIADLEGIEIDLRVYNTAGNPETAAAQAKAAVNDGAKIILGPLFAEEANAAGVAISNRNVNILAFSNKTNIAGGNVFILGNTLQNTATRVMNYTVAQGLRDVMIVHGAGDSSEENGRDALLRAAQNAGANVTATSSFELSQMGVINAIPGIAREARSSGSQALFFTSSSAGALPLLTQLLPENGVKTDTTQFVGLTRWDIPNSTLALPGVQNGWFALPDPGLSGQFTGRFQTAYGAAPHPIAGLSYDGIAAIGALARAGKSDALTHAALTQASGFVGVNGIFRLLPDGTNQRGLAIATIRENQVVVIDPAPRSFGGTGF